MTIIPIRGVGTNYAAGLREWRTSLHFNNGLSYLCSKKDGKEVTASPDQDIKARIITK